MLRQYTWAQKPSIILLVFPPTKKSAKNREKNTFTPRASIAAKIAIYRYSHFFFCFRTQEKNKRKITKHSSIALRVVYACLCNVYKFYTVQARKRKLKRGKANFFYERRLSFIILPKERLDGDDDANERVFGHGWPISRSRSRRSSKLKKKVRLLTRKRVEFLYEAGEIKTFEIS